MKMTGKETKPGTFLTLPLPLTEAQKRAHARIRLPPVHAARWAHYRVHVARTVPLESSPAALPTESRAGTPTATRVHSRVTQA